MSNRLNALTHLFSTGEVSRAALNRVDKDAMRLYAERQENLLPSTIGKAIVRPGGRMLGKARGETNKPRLLSFFKSSVARAVLEMTASTLRVWHDDELIEREEVSSFVTNGDFAASTGWTLATSSGASASIANNRLTLAAPAKGSEAIAKQQVPTSSPGEEHAIRVEVARGPVNFRIGQTDGGQEYLAETSLDQGVHSLAFTPVESGDSTDLNTLLLLHCNGTDGSTTFTDSSSYGRTVTRNGNTQIDTAQAKFGTASALFDGGSDYLNLDGSAFAFGTGDFTVEMWVRSTGWGAEPILYDHRPNGTNGNYLTIYSTVSGQIRVYINSSVILTSSFGLSSSEWYHIAVSRGSGTLRLFINGVLQGSAANTTNLLNPSNRPVIGTDGTSVSSHEFAGWIDEVRISNIARYVVNFSPQTSEFSVSSTGGYWIQFSTRRTVQSVVTTCQIEGASTLELPAPWNTDELNEVALDQSRDVVFMGHAAWQQRKIERRGNRSWSVVRYQTDDGPFTTARTADVRLTPGATFGNTTLNADKNFFTADMVGTLFRLNQKGIKQSFQLAGQGQFTDAIRVLGVGSDNDWSFSTTGTWSGTITLQRSVDGRTDGFVDVKDDGVAIAWTTNQTSEDVEPGEEWNNIIQYYRLGFKEGDYTSGVVTIEMTYEGDSDYGICRVTEYVSPTQVNIEVLRSFANVSATDDWLEGAWSDRRGWPSAVGLYDGRLWWVGEDRFWGSKSNDYYNFSLDEEGDSATIQRDIAVGGATFVGQWILGLQRLILGTDGAEVSVRSSSFDEPLTPTAITLRPASTNGVSPSAPVRVDSEGLYIDSSRKKIYKLGFNVEAQDYTSSEITRTNEELANSINPEMWDDAFVELTVQRKPEPLIWILRDDGAACPLLYNPGEEVRGFQKVITGRHSLSSDRAWDRYISFAPVRQLGEDDVYYAVERTILVDDVPTQQYFIEKFAYQSETLIKTFNSTTRQIETTNGRYMADSFITVTGTGVAGQVVSGLDHLEGREVIFIGQYASRDFFGPACEGGMPSAPVMEVTVSGGQATMPLAMTGEVCVGLPYAGFYKTAKLAYGASRGTALVAPKKINGLGLCLLDTHPDALRIGSEFADEQDMDELPRTQADFTIVDPDASLEPDREEPIFSFPGEWKTDSRACIYTRPGFSATLSALIIGIETAERVN